MILIVFAARIGGELPLATLGPPVQTDAPTPTQTADVVPEGAHFGFFSAETEVQCPPDGAGPSIQFAWETIGATEVWFTPQDADAVEEGTLQLPLSGSQDDLAQPILFPCTIQQRQEYTVTLLGEGGEHVSEHFTVTDLNWNDGGLDDEVDE